MTLSLSKHYSFIIIFMRLLTVTHFGYNFYLIYVILNDLMCFLYRSYEPPKRDEEKEVERKARAKRARETRRSTQVGYMRKKNTTVTKPYGVILQKRAYNGKYVKHADNGLG